MGQAFISFISQPSGQPSRKGQDAGRGLSPAEVLPKGGRPLRVGIRPSALRGSEQALALHPSMEVMYFLSLELSRDLRRQIGEEIWLKGFK